MPRAAPPRDTPPPGLSAGELREWLWSTLVRTNQAAYPLPPHGHNPNFKGAKAAANRLAAHPRFLAARIVLVGMEAALAPVRARVLEERKVLLVPHRTRAGSYWRLEGAPTAAARLDRLPLFGEETADLSAVDVAVVASVLVDERGARLSKGYGWGHDGPPVPVPALSVAHRAMVLERLEVDADSRLAGFATPERLVTP